MDLSEIVAMRFESSYEPNNEEDLAELSKEEYCKKYNITDEEYEMQVKWMQEM